MKQFLFSRWPVLPARFPRFRRTIITFTTTPPVRRFLRKFDLTTLPNQTVSYFVTNSGPTLYPQNDSFSSVLSQVNQAISTWNSVGTSSIRLAFGGLFNPNTPLPATPGGQVEFVQLPPGYYGMGGPDDLDRRSAQRSVRADPPLDGLSHH